MRLLPELGPEWDFRALKRSADNALLGGICGGLGKCTPWSPLAWRLIFLLLLGVSGVAIVLYIALYLHAPEEVPLER